MAFELVEYTLLGEGKRWVLISPRGDKQFSLLVARAKNPSEMASVGNQTGGRVFLFLYTDDFWRDYKSMTKKGVEFMEDPRSEPYGTVAVFKDLYGNLWDLLERKSN